MPIQNIFDLSYFKENDIRGRYPEEWNSSTAYNIGYLLPDIIPGDRIVIGRDGRSSSSEILRCVAEGLNDRGTDVIDIGIVDTPAVYFSVGYYGYAGGIMITASHNPVGYNGLKLTGKGAMPIDSGSGLDVLKKLISGDSPGIGRGGGSFRQKSITVDYCRYLAGFQFPGNTLKAVYDCSNGSVSANIRDVLKRNPENSILINSEVIADFPNHGPDPTLKENLLHVQSEVLAKKADIGFCFDGDGDRIVVVDHAGEVVAPDLITALIGLYYFKQFPGKRRGKNRVLVDVRTSTGIIEFLRELGAEVISCPVGHSKIKRIMRSEDALFAGELTGHYYFSENFHSDSAWIAVFRILAVLSGTDVSIDDLRTRLSGWGHSGEINFAVDDPDAVIREIMLEYSHADISRIDGYKFRFADWWFMVRKSGTEPLLRLVLETSDPEVIDTRRKEISEFIMSCGILQN